MTNSLRASEEGLKIVDQARRLQRWNKTASTWYQQAFTSRSTLNRFWARQLIRSEAFIALCETVGVPWQQVAEGKEIDPAQTLPMEIIGPGSPCIDWGDAPDTRIFYGREPELKTLQEWITVDHCRLLLIRGMGGIGKTMLTAKLANQLAETQTEQWDWIVWRSLRNAPELPQLLDDILTKLDATHAGRTESLHDKQLRLLDFLRDQRGLLVLDNLETLLASQQSGHLDGQGSHYEPGYEIYGDLFRLIGDSAHQSCLILTSREMPKDMVNHWGEHLPVRCFPLNGLQVADIKSLFQDRGDFIGSDEDWLTILHHYSGNPLALKIVATSVRDFFDRRLSDFLAYLDEETILFDDIKDLLHRQFERLSPAEYSLMLWLAINRLPTSLPELQQDIYHLSKGDILAGLSALQHRSLIEKSGSRFTQQPVVMEYVLTQLIEQAVQDLLDPDGPRHTLRHYAFVKPQSKDYIYRTQVTLILTPIFNRVSQQLDQEAWMALAHHDLKQLQQQPQQAAYAAGNLMNLLRFGQFDLQGLDCSELPLWQANFQGLSMRQVSLAGADLSQTVFTEMIGNVLSAAFSSDGAILGTSDNGCCLRLWDVNTGQILSICQGHQHWIRSVAFASPTCIAQTNQALIASGSADCTVRLWDVNTGIERQTLRGHGDEVFSVAFCPTEMALASASGDRTVKLWDLRTGDCIQTLEGHPNRVRTVMFGPEDSGQLASGDEQGHLHIWSLLTEECHHIVAHQGWIRTVAFTADGQVVISGGNDGMVRLWDVRTGGLIREWFAHAGGVYTLSCVGPHDLLATGGADHQIRLWDIHQGSCLTTICGHDNQIYSVAFSPDTETLAGVSLDQTVKLWNWKQNLCLKTWRGYTDWGFPITISQDGQWLVSGSGANTIHVWDPTAQVCLQSLPGYPALVRAVVMLPNHQLAAAGAAPVIQIWDWQRQQCIRQLTGHQDWVLNLAMTMDSTGDYLASCSADQSVRLWNLGTGKVEQTFLGHQDHVNAVAFGASADVAHILASASSDHQVKLWNWRTGDCLQTLVGHTHRVYGLCFHPSQPLLVSGGADLTIRLWDIARGDCCQTLMGHDGWIFAIALSPCGRYILSGGQDQQVKLWEIESGQCIQTFIGHRHQVYSVAFDPQGRWVASGSQDQTIRLWDIESGACLHQLSARLYEGMDIRGAQGLSMAQRLTLEELGAIR